MQNVPENRSARARGWCRTLQVLRHASHRSELISSHGVIVTQLYIVAERLRFGAAARAEMRCTLERHVPSRRTTMNIGLGCADRAGACGGSKAFWLSLQTRNQTSCANLQVDRRLPLLQPRCSESAFNRPANQNRPDYGGS